MKKPQSILRFLSHSADHEACVGACVCACTHKHIYPQGQSHRFGIGAALDCGSSRARQDLSRPGTSVFFLTHMAHSLASPSLRLTVLCWG